MPFPQAERPPARRHDGRRNASSRPRPRKPPGCHGIWFAENPFNRGTLPAAAACAVATKALRIGAGVFNPYNRHPTLIAMEIGALDELAGGRVQLGIGSGIGFAIERMGFSYGKPLTTLREAIAIVRALLRGEEVTHAGTVFNVNKVKLDYKPRADIPIFMAGRGDRSLEACGEIADGLIVSNMVTAAFSAKAVKIVHDAARAAGRSPPEIVQYVPVHRAARPRRGLSASPNRRWPTWCRPTGRSPSGCLPRRLHCSTAASISEADFANAAARLKAGEPAASVLDERYVRAFSIAGNADDCRARLRPMPQRASPNWR